MSVSYLVCPACMDERHDECSGLADAGSCACLCRRPDEEEGGDAGGVSA